MCTFKFPPLVWSFVLISFLVGCTSKDQSPIEPIPQADTISKLRADSPCQKYMAYVVTFNMATTATSFDEFNNLVTADFKKRWVTHSDPVSVRQIIETHWGRAETLGYSEDSVSDYWAECSRIVRLDNRDGIIKAKLQNSYGTWLVADEKAYIKISDGVLVPPEKATRARNEATLSTLRSAISIYYSRYEGKYPASLNELVPGFLPEIPYLWEDINSSHPHPQTNSVVYYNSKGDLADRGGWGYINAPGSPELGYVYVDCNHKNSSGNIWGMQ